MGLRSYGRALMLAMPLQVAHAEDRGGGRQIPGRMVAAPDVLSLGVTGERSAASINAAARREGRRYSAAVAKGFFGRGTFRERPHGPAAKLVQAATQPST